MRHQRLLERRREDDARLLDPGLPRAVTPRAASGALALTVAALGGVLAASPAAAWAAREPKLVVSALQSSPTRPVALSRFTVNEITQNAGSGTAPASVTAYFLSTDRKLSSDDLAVGQRRVPALTHGKSSSGHVRVTAPVLAAGGTYYLLACANDARRKTSARCRVASKRVAVLRGLMPPRGYFPQRPHPRTITTVVEPSHAISAVVSAQNGGTLTATGANGTRYTLTFPPGALLSDETITMTPVATVQGSPLGTLLGAVDLAPNGLQMLQAATLKIAAPGPVNPKNIAGFEAFSGGQDFGLYPLDPGNGIAMSLEHFSTEGVAEASPAELRTALLLVPARSEAEWNTLISLDLRQSPVNGVAFGTHMAAFYRDVIQPVVDRALTDDTYADTAVALLYHWDLVLEKYAFTDSKYVAALYGGSRAVMTSILENAVNQRFQRCVKSNDLSEAVRLLAIERQAAILGIDLGEAAELGEKCAHFELDVTTTASQTTETGDDMFTGTIGVEDDIPISSGGFLGLYLGQADPTYTNWQFMVEFNNGAGTAGTSVNAPSTVSFTLNYNVTEEPLPTGQVLRTVPEPTLLLRFNPGQTRELYNFGGEQSNLTLWDDVWADGHAAESVTPGTYQLKGWQTFPPGAGPLIAIKTYPTRTYCHTNQTTPCDPATSPDNITETTTLKLYHRPQ
jgi:hypothetical protein